jgi:hypothetical protein
VVLPFSTAFLTSHEHGFGGSFSQFATIMNEKDDFLAKDGATTAIERNLRTTPELGEECNVMGQDVCT